MRSILSISIIALVALAGCGKDSGELDQQQLQLRQAVQQLGAQVSGIRSVTVRFTNSALTGKDLEPLGKLGTVHYLDLSDTSVGDDGMVHINKLEGLQVLVLSGTEITDAGFSQLSNLSDLNQLTASELMGDGTMAALASATKLNFLDMTGGQVTDSGLSHLSGMKNLKRLTLSRTAITDKGLEHLQSITVLQDLQLNNTKITDEGLLLLEGLSNLNLLAITDTGTTLNGVTKLQAALPDAEFDTGTTQVSPTMQANLTQGAPTNRIASAPDNGEPVPNVTVYLDDGTPFSTSQLKESYTVLVFGCLT
uniref:Internalin-A n=1 Tax=uncultured Rhizobium sp. HF0500_35F13 TaxID=723627 RepID=E7C631_9HYPH|nr:hypothetical protein [uncultured Rhizobium sp. HF0500_35F13]